MNRFRTHVFLCCLCFLSMVQLTGCWDRMEVNDIAIIVGAGIDQASTNQVKLSAEIYIPEENNSESQSGGGVTTNSGNGKTFVSSATGSSMAEAMYKLQERLSRKLYWGHNDIFVFGQKRAEKGIQDDLDFILRYVRMRERANVYVAEGKAFDILGIIPKLEPNSMEALSELSKTEISTTVDLKQVVQQIVETPDESFSIPYINRGTLVTDKKHNRNPNVSYFQGVSLFKKTKMIGSLNTDVTWGYFWMTNNIKGNTIIALDMPHHETIAILLTGSKTTLTPRITADGKWIMKVKVRSEGNLLQNTSAIDFMSPKQHAEMVKLANEEVKFSITNTMRILQKKYKVDVVQFGDEFRKKYPKQWKKVKPNWSTAFQQVQLELDVMVDIPRPGFLNKSIVQMKDVSK
ncbi:spore germination protein KC [Paenibacillus endophyticus]|uniref:Spore germination protein KC n=1 Tax=Paenibacillus endophyticus TaxID=1294268 RepID=A0A7W5GA21_9BACL|nr:Ger(x)C family spore germination protein [Paenibacillus endophyticus]MBB3151542.1 spore germination protein KC [Paenibacillus endophyticus]